MASKEQITQYLMQQGLSVPIGEVDNMFGGNTPSSKPATSYNPDLVNVVEPKKSTQPIWKWSWDPDEGLFIWGVDPKYGQPHHIEMTGPNFYQYAQGRVYRNPDGTMEILVWEDRGSPEWQDMAVEDVQQWLKNKVGVEADEVYHQSEGGYYPTINAGSGPKKERMAETYFGVDFKRMNLRSKMNYIRMYDSVLKSFEKNKDTAKERNLTDPVQQHQQTDDKWLENLNDPEWGSQAGDVCMACNGEGVDASGHMCLSCKGTGIAPQSYT